MAESLPGMTAAQLAWVAETVAWCTPDAVHWCDGSEAERVDLCQRLVESGTFIPLHPQWRPHSWLARSDPADVARVEDRTVICSLTPAAAGPTNHWADPVETRRLLRERMQGCMAGRIMYVIPFCMGPLDSPWSLLALEITDSPYVVISMGLMTRMGLSAAVRFADRQVVRCLHSLGAPLAPGQADKPWPCDPGRTLIAHFPEEPAVCSYGSGYGGNALLGKKCLALRIASVLARDQGWMAEHMLILALIPPQGRTIYIAAAFPSACGKTNLAMLESNLAGWKVRCVGDDIAWLRIAADGSLRAINPEAGFFGVAPGTSWHSNPHAMATIARDTIFTNVALTPTGDVWWEHEHVQPPEGLIDWQGRPWEASHGPAAHPNARYTVAIEQCPVLDPGWNDPDGVPISAIVFGGRRMGVWPLVLEATDWKHGTFLGSIISSETTAAAEGSVGRVRHDPFAMLPFCGYDMAAYFAHWLAMGERIPAKRRPAIFAVNWFRTAPDGSFLWPGFGENIRVLKWIHERVHGRGAVEETAIGRLPSAGAIDVSGLDLLPGAMDRLREVDTAAWLNEVGDISGFYQQFGDTLPKALREELNALRTRLQGRSLAAS